MIRFPVSPQKAQALLERLAEMGVRFSDVEESFIHSGGKGGQNVNKVATCVRLRHLPTGISVTCQKTRQQGLNRYYAYQQLVSQMDERLNGKESAAQKRVEKIRKQKKKRAKRGRQKSELKD